VRRRRLTVGSRLAAGYALVLLLSGAVLLGGAYLVVAHASRGYDRAVAAAVGRRVAKLRADAFPAGGGPPPGLPVPGERRVARGAARAAQRAALPAYRREIAVRFAELLAAVTALSLLAGRLLARGALRPVREITAAVAAIGEHRLDRRLDADGPPDDLTALAQTLNAMLARIQVAVEAQEAFASAASHELRTPLSVIRAELDACLDRRDTSAEEWRRSAAAMRGNVARSEHLMAQLLLLARARTRPATVHLVDLAETAEALLDDLPRDRRTLCDLRPAPTEGDPALLESALGNLIANATQHNVTSGVIDLRSWTEADHACLRIGNDGPACSDDEVRRLFEPFVRGRGAGRPGTGLGLAVVRAIIEAHDGSVEACPRPRGGLDVTVRLPRATALPAAACAVAR
jgi:signal transduction histidine kinase